MSDQLTDAPAPPPESTPPDPISTLTDRIAQMSDVLAKISREHGQWRKKWSAREEADQAVPPKQDTAALAPQSDSGSASEIADFVRLSAKLGEERMAELTAEMPDGMTLAQRLHTMRLVVKYSTPAKQPGESRAQGSSARGDTTRPQTRKEFLSLPQAKRDALIAMPDFDPTQLPYA